jgi:flavodoxin
MKTLIVYDSQFGNTEKIARAIAGALTGEVKTVRVGEASRADLDLVNLMIFGSPTQGGKHTQVFQSFINGIPEAGLKGVRIASFDTRLKTKLVKIFGFAAGRLASELQNRGGTLVVQPEGFFVKGSKGPLVEGELERASAWAHNMQAS